VRIVDRESSRTVETNFLVIDILMACNVILGHLICNAIQAVVAPYLLLIQFELYDVAVRKLYGDQKMAKERYYVSLKSLGRKEEPLLDNTFR